MELLKVCADIEFGGVLLDKGYVEAGYGYERNKIEEAKQSFEKDTGRAFKDSPKLFAEIFTERGEKFPRTSKGNPSFAGDFLDHCQTPTARAIKKVRYHDKRASTYFLNFKNRVLSNGYIHPSMNQAGTVTGRFSYSNPNLQNVPKDDKDNPSNVRRCFIPPPEYRLLSIDYQQMEYRLAVDYAGEHEVIKAVLEGRDIHQVMADKVGVKRSTAKTLNFAILYGTGNEHLAHMLGCSLEAAKNIRRQYFQGLPNVQKLIQQVKRVGENRGSITNRFGRTYWCSNYSFSYKLPNYLIQGTGADVIKYAMVDIAKLLEGKKTRMVIQVHDELLFYLHEDEEYLVEEIRNIMENIYPPFNGMKLTTDAQVSDKSWGDIG